jgi:hypothetical protein
MKREDYLNLLAMAFRDLHSCEAKHLETVSVLEQYQEKKVWEGEVEVFALSGHPKATRGYAWATQGGSQSDITTVLEIPPVKDSTTAVRVSIVASYCGFTKKSLENG